MTAAVPLVERLAEAVAEAITDAPLAWDFFPDPDAAIETVARALLPVVEQAVAEARGEAWDEGYLRGTLDTTSDLEPADNPYRGDATTEGAP